MQGSLRKAIANTRGLLFSLRYTADPQAVGRNTRKTEITGTSK